GGGVGSAGADYGGGVRGVRGEGVQGGDDQEHRGDWGVAVSGFDLLVLPRQGGPLQGSPEFASADPASGGR
ncbi:MAG: Transcriptional regulator, AcrR family, partial [uncultured Rubrobacteraceae bacterium]